MLGDTETVMATAEPTVHVLTTTQTSTSVCRDDGDTADRIGEPVWMDRL